MLESRQAVLRVAGWVPLAALLSVAPAMAQMGEAGTPVGFAHAVRYPLRRAVELSGTVQSRNFSVVAAEIAGLVVQLAAREGDRVARGAPLVQLRRTDAELQLEGARGELREAEARLRLAEASRQRAEELFDQLVLSRQRLDDALSEFEAGQGRVSQLRAAVARLENQLTRTTVRAPFTAVVVRERTAVGEWIDAGGPVAEVVDTRALEARLDVPESFFAGLRLGEEVDVRVDALGGRSFPGRVRAIVPRADPRARTFPVKVELLGGVEEIGVGMLVKVLLPIGEPTPATLVPKDAVVAQGREGVLFVIEEDDTVRQTSVRTGRAAGDWIEVTGVSVGARVVTQGNERLAPGQLVIPERSEHQAP